MNTSFQWMKDRSRILFLIPFLWSFFLILSACGGGGGGGGAGSPVPTSITADFLPTSTNVSSNLIAITKKTVQGDTITLDVSGVSLSTLSAGAAFDLTFDPNLVSYIGYLPGNFYESNSTVTYQSGLQVGTNNRLVVGITQQAGPGTTGSGVLIQIKFKAIKIGSSNLTFANNNLLSPSGPPLVPGLTWVTGALMGS
ncbi:MAG: hypothetical protein HYR67_00605 [Bacteroidetes bacterium]|nr:hypothetical protein [Bacteroidota bacterium]